MKKTLLITLLILAFSAVCFGQGSGPLKFLGIPVDGTEEEFAVKLMEKGFTEGFFSGYYGQFNGEHVKVSIHTNHNLVDRVMVSFPTASEHEIGLEYNRLLSQFRSIGKYLELAVNKVIPKDEDISYNITVKNKRYQACFSYYDSERDLTPVLESLLDMLDDKILLSKDEVNRKKEILHKSMSLPKDEKIALQYQMVADMHEGFSSKADENPAKFALYQSTIAEGLQSMADGEVWFMIDDSYSDYKIILFYDNLHNQAHGEDL